MEYFLKKKNTEKMRYHLVILNVHFLLHLLQLFFKKMKLAKDVYLLLQCHTLLLHSRVKSTLRLVCLIHVHAVCICKHGLVCVLYSHNIDVISQLANLLAQQ